LKNIPSVPRTAVAANSVRGCAPVQFAVRVELGKARGDLQLQASLDRLGWCSLGRSKVNGEGGIEVRREAMKGEILTMHLEISKNAVLIHNPIKTCMSKGV